MMSAYKYLSFSDHLVELQFVHPLPFKGELSSENVPNQNGKGVDVNFGIEVEVVCLFSRGELLQLGDRRGFG